MYSCCDTGNIVHYGGDSAAQHWNRKLNLTDLCIKHIVEYSVTFITVKDRVCINLNALKRSELFFSPFPLSMGGSICVSLSSCFIFSNAAELNMKTSTALCSYSAWTILKLFKIS